MRRRLVFGAGGALLSLSVLAGALAGTGLASTRSVRLRVDATRVPVSVVCPATTASPGCRFTLQLRTAANGAARGGVVVGRTTTLVAPGKRRRITVSLTPHGRRLLHEQSPLPLIATTVMTLPPTAALGTATTPTPSPALPTPAPVPPCAPVSVAPPIGPGPDAVAVGAAPAAPLKPADCFR